MGVTTGGAVAGEVLERRQYAGGTGTVDGILDSFSDTPGVIAKGPGTDDGRTRIAVHIGARRKQRIIPNREHLFTYEPVHVGDNVRAGVGS